MSLRDPEAWMPNEGLSEMQCIQAADTMAKFCILAVQSPTLDPKLKEEIIGSYFVASVFSCQLERLETVMKLDLERAGLEPEAAADWADKMNDDNFVRWAASCRFITEDKPKYGLRKNSRGIYIDEPRFIKSILRLR